MGLRARYRRWARDVPEGAMRRDWRAHPIHLWRWQRARTGYGPLEAIMPTARELLGRPPRFTIRYRAMPWGHRGRYDVPLYPVDEVRVGVDVGSGLRAGPVTVLIRPMDPRAGNEWSVLGHAERPVIRTRRP